jgi:hypothetical protein
MAPLLQHSVHSPYSFDGPCLVAPPTPSRPDDSPVEPLAACDTDPSEAAAGAARVTCRVTGAAIPVVYNPYREKILSYLGRAVTRRPAQLPFASPTAAAAALAHPPPRSRRGSQRTQPSPYTATFSKAVYVPKSPASPALDGEPDRWADMPLDRPAVPSPPAALRVTAFKDGPCLSFSTEDEGSVGEVDDLDGTTPVAPRSPFPASESQRGGWWS